MAGIITAASIGAGASLIGAGASAGASAAAAGSSARQAAKARDYQRMIYNQTVERAQPYLATGRQGAKLYRQQMQQLANPEQYAQYQTDLSQYRTPYGMEQYQQSPLYTPMVRNLAELQATPGYQFELEQGLQALGQGAAARGGLLSGAQQKAAMKYGQGVASTGFQQAWERAQKAYGNAFEQNLRQQAQYGQSQLAQNQQNYQQRLQSRGQAADIYGNAMNVGQQTVGSLGNIGQATGANVGQAYQNIGEARAQGALGIGTSIARGFSNAGQSIYDAMQKSPSNSTPNSELPWAMRGDNWKYV